MPKLTDAQTIILSTAAQRADNLALPLPKGLHGAAAKKFITMMIGRGWLVALSIFGVGMIENVAGLAAGVLFVVVFTFYFTVSIATRPFDQPKTGSTA